MARYREHFQTGVRACEGEEKRKDSMYDDTPTDLSAGLFMEKEFFVIVEYLYGGLKEEVEDKPPSMAGIAFCISKGVLFVFQWMIYGENREGGGR